MLWNLPIRSANTHWQEALCHRYLVILPVKDTRFIFVWYIGDIWAKSNIDRLTFYLLTAGQPIIPAHKILSRVDTSQVFSRHAHGPVSLRSIALLGDVAHTCLVWGTFCSGEAARYHRSSPVQLHGRPAVAPRHSHPSQRSRSRRSCSARAWPSAWTCSWHSDRETRTRKFHIKGRIGWQP